ncbi:MAG: flippase-like domain-containing protein [Bacteroidaceae bacterium]|nr:flippase-like domain-containing protein [Bacteroidaceae bacterium]MBR1755173.1 flippase-like domain-containing protein [Bacteroidaceae bacterium]
MSRLHSILRIVLPLFLGGAILWWMYRGFDWATLQRALTSEMNWTWMWLSFPFGILAQVFRALRWRQVLRPLGEHPRLHTSINAIFLSYASSLAVPRVGEVLRCGVLKRYDGVSFSRGLGTVVTERVVDMVIIGLLSLVVFVLQIPVFVEFFEQTGVSLTGFLARFTTTGWLVTAVSGVLILATGAYLLRRYELLTRTRSIVKELTEGLLSIREVDGKGVFLFYSVAIWVCYFLHFYLTFFCFASTTDLGLDVALVAFIVGTFAVLVPTPNGAGPWHFAVKTVLMLYGVSGDEGALFALIVHTVQTLLVAVLGVYAVAALAIGHTQPKLHSTLNS